MLPILRVQIHLLIASGASFSARRSGVCLLFCGECLCRPVPHTWFSARGKFYASAPGGIAICIHWRYGLLIHCEINHYKICLAGRQQWRSISLGDGWSSAFKSCRSVFLQVRLFNNKQSRDKEWQGVLVWLWWPRKRDIDIYSSRMWFWGTSFLMRKIQTLMMCTTVHEIQLRRMGVEGNWHRQSKVK